MRKQDSGADSAAQSSSNEDQIKKEAADNLYDNREPKKIIRIITVAGYVFSVSFVAIGLSTYYLFLWEPPDPKLIERDRFRSSPRIDFLKGGSDQSINSSDYYNDLINYQDPLFQNHIGIFGDYEDYPDDKSHETSRIAAVNKSLSTLRNVLVKILQAQRNGSKSFHKEHFLVKDSEGKLSLKIQLNESQYEDSSGSKKIERSTKIENLENDKANVTFSIKPTIISGVKSNDDGFLRRSEESMNGSFRGIDQQNHNLTQFTNSERKRDRITTKED